MNLTAWLLSHWPWRTRSLGDRGEALAARHLKRLGYILLAHSQQEKFGEIDLIAVDDRTIVFVEVKTRRSVEEEPAEAVTDEKQRRITKLAIAYLKRHDLLEHRARFDIIAVTWPDDVKNPEVKHFKEAFEPTGSGQWFS